MPPSIRLAPTAAQRAVSLLRTIQFTHPPACPCHGHPAHTPHLPSSVLPALSASTTPHRLSNRRSYATPVEDGGPPPGDSEYAFELSSASIRFGPGCTAEVGRDLLTDGNVLKLSAVRVAERALQREGIDYTVFDRVAVEPKDTS